MNDKEISDMADSCFDDLRAIGTTHDGVTEGRDTWVVDAKLIIAEWMQRLLTE